MLEILGNLGLGLLIGAICGAVPLVIGLLTDRKVSGIAGIVCTALSGALFSYLDKSPLTSAVVAILFILFIIVGNKKVASAE